MIQLHDFPLSAASQRMRIGLNLKGLPYKIIPVSLVKGGGEQLQPEYRALNPQGLVPTMVHDEHIFTQSLAMLEYLDEIQPAPPFLPASPLARARVRQLAQIMVSDIHPLTNLRVIGYLRRVLKADEVRRAMWYRHWLLEGLDAVELWLTAAGTVGGYCVGEQVTLADICLVPLLASARRFGLDLDDFPRICQVEAHCLDLEAFRKAQPDGV